MQQSNDFPAGRMRWPAMFLGAMLSLSAIANTTVTRVAPWQCPLLAQAERNRPAPPSAPRVSDQGERCLAAPGELDTQGVEVFDLRDRTRFIEFHVPGAQQITVTALATQPGMSTRPAIVYDSGRFRSDAMLLCNRLRHFGFRHVHVVEGGIAAWAQLHGLPQVMTLNRLSDANIAAALSEPGSRPVILSESLRPALPAGMGKTDRIKAARLIVLAGPSTPKASIRARLKKGVTAFYWVGTPERLHQLLNTQLAQEQKRLSGPAISKACSAL